jgi:CRISPR-associated protein Csx3
MTPNKAVQLQVIDLETEEWGNCQTLDINLVKPTELIGPSTLAELELPPELDLSRAVILFGKAPAWLYTYLVRRCSEAPWIGCYDLRMQAAIVVKSTMEAPRVGDRIAVKFSQDPGTVILIGGPPNSGKSVLSNLLRLTLPKCQPSLRMYLHRANWDGEGNWSYEAEDRVVAEQLKKKNDKDVHRHPEAERLLPQYFTYHARAIENIRNVMDLTLVDLGGRPKDNERPVLQQCSHYIVISNNSEKVNEWHSLCKGLKPIAVIHSSQQADYQLVKTEPFLQFEIGVQHMLQTQTLPKVLRDAVLSSLKT